MATTKAFELAQLSAVVTSSSGVSSFTDALDINGAEILVGTNNSRFAENNLRFMATGASYIDVNTVGQALNFRVSETSSLDTTAISIAHDGKVTLPTLTGETAIDTGSLTLDGGRNIQWGGAFSSGFPTVWGHSANKQIKFAPDGTTSGLLYQMSVTQLEVNPTTASTSASTGALVVGGGAGIAENLYVGGNTVISGDLTVEGTSVTLNTTDLNVEDKNITLNYHATADTSASAGGAGITIQDAVDASTDASILWNATNSAFDFSHEITALSALTLTSNAPRIFLYEADTTDLNTALFSSGGKFTIRTTTDDDATRTTRLEVDHSTGDINFYEHNGGTPAIGMHWDYADGYLGIGDTAPEAPLFINGNESGLSDLTPVLWARSKTGASITQMNVKGDQIQFGGGATLDTSPAMTIDYGSNSVGIGTDSPDALLDLEGVTASSSPILRFTGTGNASQGDVVGQIEFYNSDTTDNTAGIMGKIRAVAGPSGGEGSLQFLVDMPSEGADANTVALHLNGNGWVGIGTDTPNATLTLSDGTDEFDFGVTANQLMIKSVTTDGSDDQRIIIDAGNGGTSSTRGAFIALSGNEASIDAGKAIYQMGNVTGSSHVFRKAGGVDAVIINSVGDMFLGENHLTASAGDGVIAAAYATGYNNAGGDLLFYGGRSTGDNPGGVISFFTGPAGAPSTNDNAHIKRMTVDSNGRVAIGSHDPLNDLHIKGSSTVAIQIQGGDGNSKNIVFSKTTGNTQQAKIHAVGDDLRFTTGTTERVKIDSDGNVYNYNNQPESRATLKLDFANLKKLHPRISFTRNSIGSYYDEEGTLKYTGYNKPRFDHNPATGESKGLLIEEDRSNHILYSQDLRTRSGQWVSYQANVEHSSEMSPEKKMNAWKISNTVNGLTYGFVNRPITNQATANAVSVYAKAGGGTFTRLGMGSRSNHSLGVIYDLTGDGSVVATYNGNGTVHSSDIEYVGYGWYRCSFVAVNLGQVNLHPLESTHSNASHLNGNVTYSRAGGSVHVYNPQVENSYYITSSIKNDPLFTSRSSSATYLDDEGTLHTSPSNTPRYSHKWNGQKFVPTGLYLENARTNYQANFFNNNTREWSAVQNAQADRTTEIAPDGSRTAYKMYSQVTNSNIKSIYKNRAITLGNMVTYSVFAKSNSLNQIFMYTDGISPTVGGVYYNLDTGETTLQNGTGYGFAEYGMEKYGNGWWRCWFSASASTGSTAYHHIDLAVGSSRSFASNVNDGVLLWGPSLEYGQTPGSYIYTTSNAGITRSEDVVNTIDTPRENDIVELTDAEDLIPQPHGTIYTEWDTNESSGQFCGIFEVLDSGTNGIDHRYTGSSLQYYLTDNISITIGGAPTPGATEKTALAYDLTSVLDSATARNGSQMNGNTAHKFPLELKRIRLGSIDLNTAYQLNGHIRSFRMYSERMSQDEINTLTEND